MGFKRNLMQILTVSMAGPGRERLHGHTDVVLRENDHGGDWWQNVFGGKLDGQVIKSFTFKKLLLTRSVRGLCCSFDTKMFLKMLFWLKTTLLVSTSIDARVITWGWSSDIISGWSQHNQQTNATRCLLVSLRWRCSVLTKSFVPSWGAHKEINNP